MSGPYDQYGGPAYNPPQGSNQYPQQQYGNQDYNQGYQHQQAGGYPQQQYGTYDQQQGGNYGQQSYGPPQQGGFQHSQYGQQGQGYNYGDVQSAPQGHWDNQYGQQHQQQQQQAYGHDAYTQNQAYQQSLGSNAPAGTQLPPEIANHQFARQSSDPNAPNYDPSAPPMPDSDRGLLGAIGGGLGGHFLGKKSDHGILGTLGGAILGSLTEDFAKKKKHGSSSHGGSSYGGKY